MDSFNIMDDRFYGFDIKFGKRSFKLYPYISEEYILTSFLDEIEKNSLPLEVYRLFKDSWNSRFWENNGYDGKTVRQDESHPNIVYFLHDAMWRTGAGGKESDIIMLKLHQKIYGKTWSGRFDYLAVRIGWVTFFKRKHKNRKNVRKLSKNEIDLYNFLNQN